MPRASQPFATTSLLLHAGFVLTGIVTTLLGPVLPYLAARWSLNDAQAGRFFVAQFVGSIAGVALSGLVVSRSGYKPALASGYLLMAAGVMLLLPVPWPASLLAVAAFGVGLGLSIPTTNLLIGSMYPSRRAAALNGLNFAWGVGAVLYPLLLALSHRALQPEHLLFGVAAALALMLGALLVAPFPPPAKQDASSALPRDKFGLLALLGVSFCLYVGIENAISGWSATYSQRVSATADPATWTTATALFWAGLLIGRAAAPLVLRRVRETHLLVCGCALSSAGIALELAATSETGVLAGIFLAGLGLSSVFPILIAELSAGFGPAAPRAGSILFALAGLGGAMLPWLVGICSAAAGSLRTALLLPLLASGALGGIALGLRRREKEMHPRVKARQE